MTKTKNLVGLMALAILIWGGLTIVSKLSPEYYTLQADWDAIQATITYSVGSFQPKPFLVDDYHWQTIAHAKPGDLITLTAKPHFPGQRFKTHCFIRNYQGVVVGQDEAAWDENYGIVLCSVLAK